MSGQFSVECGGMEGIGLGSGLVGWLITMAQAYVILQIRWYWETHPKTSTSESNKEAEIDRKRSVKHLLCTVYMSNQNAEQKFLVAN